MVLTFGGNVTEEEDTWQHEWQPLCLSVFLSQAFSLVSFPFTNLFLTLSLFLLVGLELLERDRQESQDQFVCIGGAMTCILSDTVWSTG